MSVKLKPLIALAAGLACAGILAACGSSAAPGVQQAPSGGATAASVPKTTPTPTSGPLSTKPTITTPTGPPPKTLQTKDLITGNGDTAEEGKTITVNYVGELYQNGKEFDSSWKRNQTFTTQLSSGKVIDGWVKGIDGMKVGGRRELIIPPAQAYGKAGSPPSIPPNSTLIFVVDLLSVS